MSRKKRDRAQAKRIASQQAKQELYNRAIKEVADIGGYVDHAAKLLGVQYLVASLVQVVADEIEWVLDKAHMKSNKTISIQKEIIAATDKYFEHLKGVASADQFMNWANDLEALKKEVYKWADVKDFEPRKDEIKARIDAVNEKYLTELKIEDYDIGI